ncbi:MAG: helix-turn-helix transcriptional regulator [Gammaproteobacteria bacterium]|nr:helix-turn-helix transcriptional regulator [Gammaproteobacteria bacterium]
MPLTEDSREETIRLVAEDLRAARARLGITPAQAASRAGIGEDRYRTLERGSAPSSDELLREQVLVCRRLGVESVRTTYVEEIGQSVNIDLSRDAWREPATGFLDILEVDIAELPDRECFVSPAVVFGFLERIGFGATLASRKPADKQMVELLTGAVFTLFLDEANDYYVMPVKDDPPDVQVLAVERESRAFSTIDLEIVQYGQYSESVFEVIGTKLAKWYAPGTVVVVVVETTTDFLVADLHDFIRDNNPHGQQVFVISGAGGAGRFIGLPCDQITCDESVYYEWTTKEVEQRDRNAGFLGLDGVFCETSGLARFLRAPMFVKEVKLSR